MLSILFFANKKEYPTILVASEDERLKFLYSLIRNRLLFKIDTYIIKTLLEYTDWLVVGEKTLSTIIIKSFKIRKQLYFGPNNHFSNMTFGEFIFADTMFINFFEKNDPAILNKLIAILYRPQFYFEDDPQFKGDKRQDFNENLIKYHSKQIAKLKPQLKSTILFNYHTIRKWLTEKYIYVFGTYKQDTEQTQKKSTDNGWLSVLKNLSPDILQIDSYTKQPLHNVLEHLNIEIHKSMTDSNK